MPRSREIKASDIVLKSRFMPSTVVVRRAVFQEVGDFDTNLRSSEDRDMWIRIAEKHRLQFSSETMVRIRKHEMNMSRNADRMRLNMRKVLMKYFRGAGASPRLVKTFLKAFSFHYFEVGWMYYDEKRFGEAVLAIMGSLFLWPCFRHPTQNVEQPIFFRPRALLRFSIYAAGLNRS